MAECWRLGECGCRRMWKIEFAMRKTMGRRWGEVSVSICRLLAAIASLRSWISRVFAMVGGCHDTGKTWSFCFRTANNFWTHDEIWVLAADDDRKKEEKKKVSRELFFFANKFLKAKLWFITTLRAFSVCYVFRYRVYSTKLIYFNKSYESLFFSYEFLVDRINFLLVGWHA